MKRISYIFMGVLLLLQSCVKEDLSNCKSELLLRFRYTLNDQYSNLFGSEVSRISVYLFDSKGKYVDNFSESGDKLTNDYVMRIALPAGSYDVVAYGGEFTTYDTGEHSSQTRAIDQTLRKGVTDIHDFHAELKSISGEDGYLFAIGTPDDLYAGLAVGAVSALNNQEITDVALIKNTKKIKVKITGITTSVDPHEVHITAVNGRYGFDNMIDPNHGTFKYLPIRSWVQPNYLEVDLKMMRLMLGQTPMLVIRNRVNAQVVYNGNMIDHILSTNQYVSQEDLDREDEFVFEFTLVGNLVIGVSVNGWQINDVHPAI